MKIKRIKGLFMVLLLLISSLVTGISPAIATSSGIKPTTETPRTVVYHDHPAYLKAMAQYKIDEAQYQKALTDQAVIQQEISQRQAAGQYTGPEIYSVLRIIEQYLNHYAALQNIQKDGLSVSGEDFIAETNASLTADSYTGNPGLTDQMGNLTTQWDFYRDVMVKYNVPSQGSGIWPLIVKNAIAQIHSFSNDIGGITFYHTYTSTTNQTPDNVPAELDNPTEAQSIDAVNQLLKTAPNQVFNGSTKKENTYLFNQTMVTKWQAAMTNAKQRFTTEYMAGMADFTAAFEQYNQTEYKTADFNQLLTATTAATEKISNASNLIAGTISAFNLTDADFYNDLNNQSAAELAEKYGYQPLLMFMSQAAVYGYFNNNKPAAGEEIGVAIAAKSVNYTAISPLATKTYKPVLKAPIMPAKPVYEPQNTINITKMNQDSSAVLAGATFKLLTKSGTVMSPNLTTDATGKVQVTNLQPDQYQLIETAAPNGYLLDATPTSFEVKGTANEVINVAAKDIKAVGVVNLTKTDSQTNGKLANAVFELQDSTGVVLKTDLKTGTDGILTISDLAPGDYQLVEKSAPEGYQLDQTPLKFNIKNNEDTKVDLSMKNDSVLTQVIGQKTWVDQNNQDGQRPTSITVNLLANGKKVDSQKVTEKENWQYAFEKLPVYRDGKKIDYQITEDKVAGYTTTVVGNDLTNTHETAVTKVAGQKTWVDQNNQDGQRPTSITVNLLANGKKVDSQKVTEKENWQYAFEKLPAYQAGKKIDYQITEDKVAGYTTTVAGNDLTNTHETAVTKVTGQKTWVDQNNQDGQRPTSITVNLLANGKQVATQKVTEKENWQYAFEKLPVYQAGKKIDYQITEDKVAGYTTTVAGSDLTNTRQVIVPSKTSKTGQRDPSVKPIPAQELTNHPSTNQATRQSAKKATAKKADKQAVLPQTGVRTTLNIAILGLLLMVLSMMIGGYRLRRKN